MLQLTLNIKDKTKIAFFLELLKRMEFVEIAKSNETTEFEVDKFIDDIYQEREISASELSQKLNNLFDS